MCQQVSIIILQYQSFTFGMIINSAEIWSVSNVLVNLANKYCDISENYGDILLCFNSSVEMLNGCFMYNPEQENYKPFYLSDINNEVYIDGSNITTPFNGTLVSIFCSVQCGGSTSFCRGLIFNSLFIGENV